MWDVFGRVSIFEELSLQELFEVGEECLCSGSTWQLVPSWVEGSPIDPWATPVQGKDGVYPWQHASYILWDVSMFSSVCLMYALQNWRWLGWVQMGTSQILDFLSRMNKATPSTCLQILSNSMAGTVGHLELNLYIEYY